MDTDELARLVDQLALQGSELQDTEVKLAGQGLPSTSVLESMSAFANRRGGGVIVFGLDEAAGYAVVGVYDAARLQEEMAALASDAMEPPIRLDFTLLERETGTVVAAEVPECPDERKPCYIRSKGLANGAYRRVGNTNRRMTAEELAQFLGSLRDDFEAEPVRRATLEDLDADAIERYRQAIIDRQPDSGVRHASVAHLLRRGGFAVEEGQRLIPTVAGLLVFGDAPEDFLPRAVVTVTQFEGTTSVASSGATSRYVFDREITGRVRDVIVSTVETLMSRVGRRAQVRGLWREEVPEYPEAVIREAVTNAVAHRSYAYRGTAIRIRIFSDRIEIRSPGTLFGTVTLENIEHEQSTRNPRLAAALREFGLMEQRGTGVSMMIAEMSRQGLAPPAFEESDTSFQVTLRNAHLMSPEMREWLARFASHDLSEPQMLALAYLRLNGRMVNGDYQRINSVDGPTATRDLRGLVETDLVQMHGTRGGAFYTLRGQDGPALPTLPVGHRPRDSREAIVRLVAHLQPASRSAVAKAFYGRDDLTDSELRAVGDVLQELAREGRLVPRGERKGRVYFAGDRG